MITGRQKFWNMASALLGSILPLVPTRTLEPDIDSSRLFGKNNACYSHSSVQHRLDYGLGWNQNVPKVVTRERTTCKKVNSYVKPNLGSTPRSGGRNLNYRFPKRPLKYRIFRCNLGLNVTSGLPVDIRHSVTMIFIILRLLLAVAVSNNRPPSDLREYPISDRFIRSEDP